MMIQKILVSWEYHHYVKLYIDYFKDTEHTMLLSAAAIRHMLKVTMFV